MVQQKQDGQTNSTSLPGMSAHTNVDRFVDFNTHLLSHILTCMDASKFLPPRVMSNPPP